LKFIVFVKRFRERRVLSRGFSRQANANTAKQKARRRRSLLPPDLPPKKHFWKHWKPVGEEK